MYIELVSGLREQMFFSSIVYKAVVVQGQSTVLCIEELVSMD